MGIDDGTTLDKNREDTSPLAQLVPLPPNLRIDRVCTPDLTVLTVFGEVDVCTAPSLDALLRSSQAAGRRVLVDLEDVEFMDCAGLRVLLSAAARSNLAGFMVRSVPPQVQRLIDLTRQSSMLDFFFFESRWLAA